MGCCVGLWVWRSDFFVLDSFGFGTWSLLVDYVVIWLMCWPSKIEACSLSVIQFLDLWVWTLAQKMRVVFKKNLHHPRGFSAFFRGGLWSRWFQCRVIYTSTLLIFQRPEALKELLFGRLEGLHMEYLFWNRYIRTVPGWTWSNLGGGFPI